VQLRSAQQITWGNLDQSSYCLSLCCTSYYEKRAHQKSNKFCVFDADLFGLQNESILDSSPSTIVGPESLATRFTGLGSLIEHLNHLESVHITMRCKFTIGFRLLEIASSHYLLISKVF
jgi:hypothetical protein